MLLLYTVILLLSFCNPHPFCKRNQWGTYCTEDLTGYRECTGWSWIPSNRYKLIKERKCPSRTRCSCFIGNDCGGFLQKNESDICQPFKQSYPVTEVIHVRYRRSGWRQLDPWNSNREKFTYRGEIKQNIWEKSKLEIWIENDKRYFELIKPYAGGGFIKYAGSYPRTCEKTIATSFVALGAEIFYYTHNKTIKMGKRYEKQKWDNNVYHRDGGIGLERKWTVIADKKKRKLYPVTYTSSYTASQEDQCCDFYESVRYYRMPVRETRDWFKVPVFCP